MTLKFQVGCEAAVKPVEIGLKRARHHDTPALSMSKFSPLLNEDLGTLLKEIKPKKVYPVLYEQMVVALHRKKDEGVYQIVFCMFLLKANSPLDIGQG